MKLLGGASALVKKLGKHRLILILIVFAVIIGASLPPFMTASCLTRQQTAAEIRTLETLRSMTRGGVLPADEVVARIETDFPRTKAAALARMVRARIKVRANDYAGAATLLDTNLVRDHTSIGDYALFMRANALEQTGKSAEARAAFDRLEGDYSSSIRAREAKLRSADLLLKAGQPAALPALLSELAAKDDPAALLLSAKAYTQSSDTTRALAAYRRIYFFAPVSSESTQAANAIPQLGSNLSPASAEEAIARADRFYAANKYGDALQAYTDAIGKFASLATTQNQLRRG
ncbi:MAG: tetratricopeptide repeat protein, partial [Pyrinomonadaceae bacterium]